MEGADPPLPGEHSNNRNREIYHLRGCDCDTEGYHQAGYLHRHHQGDGTHPEDDVLKTCHDPVP